MKIVSLLLLLVVVTLSCNKQTPSGCIKARVVRITCASTVLQALDNDAVGEDGWLDIFDEKKSYDNVFTISNPCNIASEHKPGNTVYITIAKGKPGDCIRCALYDAPPKVSYELKSIGSLPCNEVGTK